MTKLTHISSTGEAHMVDVGDKDVSQRQAVAQGAVKMLPDTLKLAVEGNAKKGDVFSVARIAGIMGAKKTPDLIPLCHPIGLTKVSVTIEPDNKLPGLRVIATAGVAGQTGVEMEALTACSVACLTIYDMLKAADKAMSIVNVSLHEKTGGKSGDWKRSEKET